MSPFISPEHAQAMGQMASAAMPHETGGLLFADGTLVEVPNSSQSPIDEYRLDWQAARELVEMMGRSQLMSRPVSDVLFWHSHCSELVGPSQRDMQWRRNYQALQCAVVTVEEGTPRVVIY